MQRPLRICMCSALPSVPAVHAAPPPARDGVASPSKTSRIADTYPPDGPTDTVARAVGQKLTEAGSGVGMHQDRRLNAVRLPGRASPSERPFP